jgi:hypothetical protein
MLCSAYADGAGPEMLAVSVSPVWQPVKLAPSTATATPSTTTSARAVELAPAASHSHTNPRLPFCLVILRPPVR